MDIATLGIAVKAEGVDRASTSLDKFSGSAKKAEGSARGIGAGATDASRRTVAANDNAIKSTNRLGGAFDVAKRNVIAFGAAAAAALVAAFSVRPVFEFRDALAEVSTLVDTATFDMAALEKAALSQSTAFGGGATAQVKAYYQIISAGAKTAAEATETLTAANKLAIGGVTDIRMAADGLTSVLNAYGDRVESATAVSDAMFVGMRAGKTTIGELSGALGRVAPLAAQTGVSFDELVASVSALTKGGISTNEAITGVRAILAAVAKPSAEAVELADKLGIKFNSAALEAKGLGGFLEELADKTGGSTDKLAQLFGGVEALVPIMALSGSAGEAFSDILEQMGVKAGATEDAFNKMANSPGFQAGRVWAALEEEVLKLGNTMGTVLVPVMRALADNMENIFKWAKVAGAALLVAFGPTILAAVWSLTTAVGVGLVGAFNALTAAMLRNPFGAFLVAVTVAITSLYQFRDEVRQTIGVDVIGYFLRAGNTIINSFRAAFADVTFIWNNLPDIIALAVVGAVNRVIGGVNDMIRTATAGIDALIEKLNSISALNLNIAPIGGSLSIPELANPAPDFAAANAEHLKAIRDILSSDPLGANDLANGVDELGRTLDNGFGKVVNVGDKFPDAIARTTSAVEGVNASLDSAGDRIAGAIGQQTSALTTALDRGFARTAGTMGDGPGAFGGSIGGTQAARFSVNVAARDRVDELARDRAVIQAGIQFKQLSPDEENQAQLELARIDLETAKLNQHMGEVTDAFQDLKPALLSMFASGMDFDMIVQSINHSLSHRFGVSGTNFFSGSAIPDFAGAFADGGTIPRDKFGIVGERGPELIRGPAEITPLNGARQQAAVTHNNDNSSREVHAPVTIVVNGATDADSFRHSEREIGRRIAAELEYHMQGR